MTNNLRLKLLAGLLLFVIATVTIVIAAVPEGPGVISEVNQTRKTPAVKLNETAMAGNITHLVITGKSVTQSWQGFVGNVSGTISLENANGDTLYNWSLARPSGEIYATTLEDVSWVTGDVICWNWSNGSEYHLQLEELGGWETDADWNPLSGQSASMRQSDVDIDSVNNTFNYSDSDGALQMTHTSFFVGDQLINGSVNSSAKKDRFPNETVSGAGPCPVTKTFNSSGDAVFEEVLLYQRNNGGVGDGVIWTSIISQDTVGYDGNDWDFQMLVGENGHFGDTQVTTYYFYIEIE